MRIPFNAAAILPYADELVSDVERDGVTALDPVTTCHHIGIIKMAVEHKAVEGHHCQIVRGRITAFSPGIFTREFNALGTLCNNLQFSDAWHNRVRSVSITLAQQLSMMNPSAKLEAMQKNLRLPFLTAIAAQQARLFSDSTMTFTNPDITVGAISGLKGALEFDPGNPGDPSSTRLLIGEYFLAHDSMSESLKTIWHEDLHGFHLQLAAMKIDGTIAPGHKFYEDAAMLEAKLNHGAFIQSYYPTQIYRADVEERLCHRSQDEFIGIYHSLDAARALRPGN